MPSDLPRARVGALGERTAVIYVTAFVVGGAITALAQFVTMRWPKVTPAHILVSLTVIGAILGAFGIYDSFIQFAGAGALIPVSGFGASITKGIMEETQRLGWEGLFTGAFEIVGLGLAAAIVFGFVIGLVARPRD